jgi:hypothetical protein
MTAGIPKAALFFFFGLGLGASGRADTPGVTGTYELLICKSSCSFSNPQLAIARGRLVLSDSPLSTDEVKKTDRFHLSVPGERLRACFSGARPMHAETYAFIGNSGATTWTLTNNLLRVSLYRSPDAGYEAELHVDGDILSGQGRSWGAGVAAPRFGPDVIVGRRVGPPDISACAPAT